MPILFLIFAAQKFRELRKGTIRAIPSNILIKNCFNCNGATTPSHFNTLYTDLTVLNSLNIIGLTFHIGFLFNNLEYILMPL